MNARTIALTERGWAAVKYDENPAQLALVFTARDEALAIVTEHASDWDKHLIEQAVFAHIDMYGSCSANDFRDLLPEIGNRKLIGAQIRSLAMRRLIVKVGEETSTDIGTHAKPICRWSRPSLSVLDDQKEA